MPPEYLAANWQSIPMVMKEWAIENSIDPNIKALVEKDGVAPATRNFLKYFSEKK